MIVQSVLHRYKTPVVPALIVSHPFSVSPLTQDFRSVHEHRSG